jgi:small conductance mechanosensitive channel
MNWQEGSVNIDNIFETVSYWVTTYSMKLVAALLVFIVGKWLSGHIPRIVVRLLEKNKAEPTLIHFLENLIYYSPLVLVLVAAASQLGINTTSFLTIIGAAGLAVGLALKDPAPAIAVSELADGSVNCIVRPWVKSDDYWPVYFDLTEKVKTTFDKEDITIPFPQRDVHLYQTNQ